MEGSAYELFSEAFCVTVQRLTECHGCVSYQSDTLLGDAKGGPGKLGSLAWACGERPRWKKEKRGKAARGRQDVTLGT